MKAQKGQKPVMPQEITAPPPAWVQEAQIHFQQNGFYRAADLQRVLGDPGVSVASTAADELPVNHTWKHVG